MARCKVFLDVHLHRRLIKGRFTIRVVSMPVAAGSRSGIEKLCRQTTSGYFSTVLGW